MDKLYFTPGACSLAPHILFHELGLEHELVKVNLKTKMTKAGEDFTKINPKGVIPYLIDKSGEEVGECAVILQYLAHRERSPLLPQWGSPRYFQMAQWLHFIATDLHKGFTPLFAGHHWIENVEGLGQLKSSTLKILDQRLKYIDRSLKEREFLVGEMTIADVYLYNVVSWSKYVEISLSDYPELNRFMSSFGQRPSVAKVLEGEGLL